VTTTEIELMTESILGRWQKGKEPQLTESLDLDLILRCILFRDGQQKDGAIHLAEMWVRAEAERAAKLRADNTI